MRNERGMSGSVQVAVLLPVTLGIFLLLLQWSFMAWAESTALSAAQQGASSAARLGSDQARAREQAAEVADNGSLTDVRISVRRGARHTTASVTGTAVTVVWTRQVTKTVVVTSERLTGS